MNEYLKLNLPVIFFFQNSKKLNEFLNSDNFKGYSCQIFKEEDNNKEKALKVLKACQARTISLATKNFGRGTDFCCDDQEVSNNGGLVVI
jgi:preprotein translocase subunit SecA